MGYHYESGISTIDTRSQGTTIYRPSIVIDQDDIPCITYSTHSDCNSNVIYATIVDDKWSVGTINNTHYSRDYSKPAITIDSQKRIHLVYKDDTYGTQVYARKDDDG